MRRRVTENILPWLIIVCKTGSILCDVRPGAEEKVELVPLKSCKAIIDLAVYEVSTKKKHFFIYRIINLLKPTGYVMHHQFNIKQLYALPTLYLCVLYLSKNKQRLVPLTA
jgi:hypothetical protein